MIAFTIKTLDSTNHRFEVDDDITITQLKEKIKEQIGIDPSMQRLIFCGRVLIDEKKLADYNVEGKVLHLVQQAPPSPRSRNRSLPDSRAFPSTPPNTITAQQIRRLMTMASATNELIEEQQMPPTAARLDFIRRMITDIKSELAVLRAVTDGQEVSGSSSSEVEPPREPMETDAAPAADDVSPQPEPEDTEAEAQDPATRDANARRRAVQAMRERNAGPRDLALLVEQLESLHRQFTPYRAAYLEMLRDANTTPPRTYTEGERERAQRIYDAACDVMHSFSHAWHAVSEISFSPGARVPRLSSDSVANRPIPMQAQINVFQTSRGADPSAPATPTEPGPAFATSTPLPNNNFSIQPDPITYEVEIETSMPIAFALDNSLVGGLGGAAGQAAPSGQGTAPQSAPNRRQTMADFENQLFFGTTQTGGMEVEMRMQDIGGGGSEAGNNAAATPAPETSTTAPGAPSSAGTQGATGATAELRGVPQFADFLVSPFAWGGPPGGELLQSIVSSVIRQGLIPEQMTHAMQAAAQAAHNAAVQAGPQAAARAFSQQAMPAADQAVNQAAAAQATAPPPHQAAPPRRRNMNMRRGGALSSSNFVYDRFLQCNNAHSRRRTQRRREQHERQMSTQARIEEDRQAASNILTLRDRASGLTNEMMQSLRCLLHSPNRPDLTIVALLVTIARELFLTELMHPVIGEPIPMPADFTPLQQHLRAAVTRLLDSAAAATASTAAPTAISSDNATATETATAAHREAAFAAIGENAYEAAADHLMQLNAGFIELMSTITPMRPEVDVYRSIHSLIRCRLPAVITAATSTAGGDWLAARFFSVFGRLFTDLCAIVSYCSQEGVVGLRSVYNTYLEDLVGGMSPEMVGLGRALAAALLERAVRAVPLRTNAVQQYVRNRGDSKPLQVPSRTGTALIYPAEVYQAAVQATQAAEQAALAAMTAAGRNTSTASTSRAGTSGEPPAARRPVLRYSRISRATNRLRPTERRHPSMQSVLNNFGPDFFPVFERDRVAQQAPEAGAAAPFSDAYLAGMPSRKRRCVRQARPPLTLDAFMAESLRDAGEAAGASGTNAVAGGANAAAGRANTAAVRTSAAADGANSAAVRTIAAAGRANSAPGGTNASASGTNAAAGGSNPDSAAMRAAFRERIRALTSARAADDADYQADRYGAVVRFLDVNDVREERKPEDGAAAEEASPAPEDRS